MSSQKAPRATKYTLNLTFDPVQVSDALQFELASDKISAEQTSGPDAGTFAMNQGDSLSIEVVAVYAPEGAPTIQVMDLTLVCSPANGVDQPDLSPYDSDSAGIYINKWKAGVPAKSTPPETIGIMYAAKKRFKVVSQYGQWQVAGYLSAKITNESDGKTSCKVYEFDPIVIVRGGGGTP